MFTQQQLFTILDSLNIKHTNYIHEPLYTCEQAASVKLPGAQCKNLFLKDSKKRLYLVVACAATAINLKQLSKKLAAPELRFANADLLMQHLGLLPGSVTPFGLINDKDHAIAVILDKNLFDHDLCGFHPLSNDAMTVIDPKDLIPFIKHCGNSYQIINFEELIDDRS